MSDSYVTLWTVARQAPLSMGFLRQEYWSELPFLSPGDLPDSGIEPASLTSSALQADSLLLSHAREDPLIIKSMLIKSTLRNPLPLVRTAIIRKISKE